MTPEERLDAQMAELVEVTALVTSSLDPAQIRRRAVEAAVRLVDAERASLLLTEKRGGRLYFEVALGDGTEALSRARLVPGQGIAGSVLASCTPEIVADVASDPRQLAGADAATGYVTRSMLAVPLTCRGEVLGVLEIINKREGAFTARDLELAAALAGQVAIAVQNARLFGRLRSAYFETWVYAALLAAVLMAAGGWLLAAIR